MPTEPGYTFWANSFVSIPKGGTRGKEPVCQGRRHRDEGLIPGSGRSPGEEHGNPLQYSCLENPMDRGAWWATVHRIAKRQTRLKLFNMRTHTKSQWGGDSVPVSFHSSPIIKKQKIGIHDTCVSLGTVWVVKNRRNRRLLIQPLSVT